MRWSTGSWPCPSTAIILELLQLSGSVVVRGYEWAPTRKLISGLVAEGFAGVRKSMRRCVMLSDNIELRQETRPPTSRSSSTGWWRREGIARAADRFVRTCLKRGRWLGPGGGGGPKAVGGAAGRGGAGAAYSKTSPCPWSMAR